MHEDETGILDLAVIYGWDITELKALQWMSYEY